MCYNTLKMDRHSLTMETLSTVSQHQQYYVVYHLRHRGGRAC
jgi:hypothetical protein